MVPNLFLSLYCHVSKEWLSIVLWRFQRHLRKVKMRTPEMGFRRSAHVGNGTSAWKANALSTRLPHQPKSAISAESESLIWPRYKKSRWLTAWTPRSDDTLNERWCFHGTTTPIMFKQPHLHFVTLFTTLILHCSFVTVNQNTLCLKELILLTDNMPKMNYESVLLCNHRVSELYHRVSAWCWR